MRIYLIHPISGLSYDDVVEYYNKAVDFFRTAGLEVLYPMTGKNYLRNEKKFRAEGYKKHPASTNHAIFGRDKWMVQSADILYANFVKATKDVSIGSVMELAMGKVLGKHTIVAMGKENIHRHAFVLEAADIIFETDEEAKEYIEKLSRGRM